MTAPVSRAVAEARAAYGSRKVSPTGEPTGETEDLSDGDGFVPAIVTMQAPGPAPPDLRVDDTDTILATIRGRVAALDYEIARLDEYKRQRAMLTDMLDAASKWAVTAPAPVAPTTPAPPPIAPPVIVTMQGVQAPRLTVEDLVDTETDEERQHAAELKAWQQGGPRPSWMQ